MNWRIPLILLSVVFLLTIVITFLIYGRQDLTTVHAPIGIQFSTSKKARLIDEEIANIQRQGTLPKELLERLSKTYRSVELNPYYLDQCEVSQLRYEQYFNRQVQGLSDAEKAASFLRSDSTGHRVAGRLDSAATGISFAAAQSYCLAAGGRLPFAEEIEVAAAGAEGRLYPWGNDFTSDPWPYKDIGRNAAQVCGSHPHTATPQGVFDLASNVMEWGQGFMKAKNSKEAVSAHGAPPIRVRGRELYALNAAWLLVDPTIKSHHLGFRCAYDTPPRIQIWSYAIPEAAYIPGGTYILGLPPDARLPRFVTNMPELPDFKLSELLVQDEKVETTIEVSSCEITREEYRRFLNDPLVRLGLFGNDNEPAEVDYVPLDWETQVLDLTLPVSGVNWWSADAYARWVGGRLPTVDEWRQLSTGIEAHNYPWGNEFLTATSEEGELTLHQCGSLEFDSTPTGINDLGGNLSEWTKSVSAQRGRLTIWVQGGNWRMFTPETASSVFGRLVPLAHRSESIGFRVVFD